MMVGLLKRFLEGGKWGRSLAHSRIDVFNFKKRVFLCTLLSSTKGTCSGTLIDEEGPDQEERTLLL